MYFNIPKSAVTQNEEHHVEKQTVYSESSFSEKDLKVEGGKQVKLYIRCHSKKDLVCKQQTRDRAWCTGVVVTY